MKTWLELAQDVGKESVFERQGAATREAMEKLDEALGSGDLSEVSLCEKVESTRDELVIGLALAACVGNANPTDGDAAELRERHATEALDLARAGNPYPLTGLVLDMLARAEEMPEDLYPLIEQGASAGLASLMHIAFHLSPDAEASYWHFMAALHGDPNAIITLGQTTKEESCWKALLAARQKSKDLAAEVAALKERVKELEAEKRGKK